jgi:PAS domain S-box-containing protein
MEDTETSRQQPVDQSIQERTARRRGPAVNTVIDSMTLINRSYVYEFASDAYCLTHGRSRKDIVGNRVANIWGEVTFNEVFKKHLDRCFVGNVVHYDQWLDFPGQGYRCYRISYSPYFNDNGEVTHAMVASQDITDLKKEEEALEKSEPQFRTIMKNMHYGVCTFDREGRFAFVNDVVVERSGYPREWLSGKSLFDLIRPQEREAVQRHFDASVRGEQVPPYEFAYRRRTGDRAWVHIGTTAMREGGRIVGVLGLLLDVTKQREFEEALKDSEQKMRSILHGSPIPQFVIDKDHRVTHWNRALEMLTGVKAEEVLGTRQHWKAFYDTERPCIADLMVDEATGEMPDWYGGKFSKSNIVDGAYKATDFFHAIGKEGKWLYFTAAVIRDSKDKIVGALETLEDITDYKLATEELKKMIDKGQ